MLALGERNTQPISFYASLLKKATVDEAGRNGLPVMKTGFAEKQQIKHDGSEDSPSTDSTAVMTPH